MRGSSEENEAADRLLHTLLHVYWHGIAQRCDDVCTLWAETRRTNSLKHNICWAGEQQAESREARDTEHDNHMYSDRKGGTLYFVAPT